MTKEMQRLGKVLTNYYSVYIMLQERTQDWHSRSLDGFIESIQLFELFLFNSV